MAFQEAVESLSSVASFAQRLLPELGGNGRNLRVAQDVSGVFDLYASRLRAKSSPESKLTNTQGDLIRDIAKSAENALKHFDEGASPVVDRAFANGEAIEKSLDLLVNSLNAASAAHCSNSGSAAGRSQLSALASILGGVGTIQGTMETVRLGLAILAEVRASAKSLEERISCAKEEGALVELARIALTRVNTLTDNITSLLAKPNAIPKEILVAFKNVKVSLAATDTKQEHLLSYKPLEKANSCFGVVLAEPRAEQIAQGLREVLCTACRAEVKLKHQLSRLCTAVKCDEMEDEVQSLVESNRFADERF